MVNIRPYVLLVEDSKMAREAAAGILAELGCLVDLAEGGVKALRLVKKNHYDMIFMDLGLADAEGTLIVEKIKEIDGAKQIPIIALTAYYDEVVKEKCFKIGMAGFIRKPLEIEKARHFLEKYLSK
jgi:CheY-like chemotaxis protein